HRGQLGLGLQDLGMVRPESGLVLGYLAVEIGLLLTQRAQRGVVGDLGDVGDLIGVEAGLGERDQAALLLDATGLGRDVACVQVRQRLGGDDALGAARQALVATVGGDRLFRDLQVAAQFGQTLLQPFGGAPV